MRRCQYRHYVILGTLVLWALAMAGCEPKTINEIKADPSRYANHEVAVVGTVTRSYSVIGKGVYEIEDGTGRLWVVSDKGVPREGARVIAKGKIRDAFNLGAIVKLPEPISSGIAMMENYHRAK